METTPTNVSTNDAPVKIVRDVTWLNGVISAFGGDSFSTLLEPGETIVRFENESVAGAGEGFLSELCRYVCRTSNDRCVRVVVKFLASNPDVRAIVLGGGLFERELRFYAFVARTGHNHYSPSVLESIPPCYAGALQGEEEGDGFLVLRDMSWTVRSPASVARIRSVKDGVSVNQCEAMIDWLAAFHAPFFGRSSDELEALLNDGRPTVPEPALKHSDLLQETMSGELPILLEFLGDTLAPELRAQLERLATKGASIENAFASSNLRLSICHGDMYCNNVLFDESTGELVSVVDFQFSRPTAALLDVTLFLYLSLDVDERRANEERLIERYVAKLAEYGAGVGYSSADARRECREGVFGMTFAIFSASGSLLCVEHLRARALGALEDFAKNGALEWCERAN